MTPEVEKLVKAGKLSQQEGDKLSKLTVGSFCQHKSWGAGRVKEWDLLADRMTVDFESKAGHSMKLGFGAASLEPLPATHFLARRVGDLEGLRKMAKEDPAALITLALSSNGNKLTLDQLEALLSPQVIPAAEYKSWWSSAKKAVKDKRHIVIPAKRSEPVILRDSGTSPAAAMVKGFISARELRYKLNALEAIQKDLDLFQDPVTELKPMLEDLSNTVRKAWTLHLKEALHLVLARDELLEAVPGIELPAGSITLVELLRNARPQLAEAVNSLPAAMMTRAYKAFPEAFPDRAWVDDALAHLTKSGGRGVAEIADLLDANDELDVLAEYLKKAVRNRRLSTDLLVWICRERDGLSTSVFDLDFGNAVLDALHDDHVAGGPKRTGRLNAAFSDEPELMTELAMSAEDHELRAFGRRILGSLFFDELTRRALMGRIIKARPEMQDLMEDTAARDSTITVSWESLEQRKLDLEDLVKNKIPQNKKDIQIAREYGDLRENFEYKSARQQQTFLMRLQNKYERELRQARGTDFVGISADKAGIGTIVEFEDVESGARETYTILGAWDSVPENQIISYLSGIAKALMGKTVGDEAELPTEENAPNRRVRVLSIKAYKLAEEGQAVTNPHLESTRPRVSSSATPQSLSAGAYGCVQAEMVPGSQAFTRICLSRVPR